MLLSGNSNDRRTYEIRGVIALVSICLLSGTLKLAVAQQQSTAKDDQPDGGARTAWGDVSGRFVVNNDQDFDSTESAATAVNPENGGLANVIVALRPADRLAIHPSYEESAHHDVVMTVRDRRFEPRVAALRTSQKLIVRNRDRAACNPTLRTLVNPQQDFLLGPNEEDTLSFTKAESLPVPLMGNIASSLQAHVIIMNHPYVAVTDANGEFTIENVPVGTQTFQAWHDTAGWISDVTWRNKHRAWEKGRFSVDVRREDNRLGVIRLTPALFSP